VIDPPPPPSVTLIADTATKIEDSRSAAVSSESVVTASAEILNVPNTNGNEWNEIE